MSPIGTYQPRKIIEIEGNDGCHLTTRTTSQQLSLVNSQRSTIFSPVVLPCGQVIQNRLVKVSMYEHLADFSGGPPNARHFQLYSRWGEHDWGMILTGNVQVSPSHLTLGRDMVIPVVVNDETLRPFRTLAASILCASLSRSEVPAATGALQRRGPIALMQLSHAGRQSPNFLGGRLLWVPPLAPSAVPCGTNQRHSNLLSRACNWLLFPTPRAMTHADVDDVVAAFARGARVASASGFHGIQLHAAHGYLLTQFLSPKSNRRTDEYGAHSLHLLYRIVHAIRSESPRNFVLGIKINSADYIDAASDEAADIEGEQHAMEHIRTIANWGNVDFIEITGGTYDDPDFMTTPIYARKPRQALFSRFSRQALSFLKTLPAPTPLVLLTGGLRTPAQLHTALAQEHAHLLGIGRGSVLRPDLPSVLPGLRADDERPFAREPGVEVGRVRMRRSRGRAPWWAPWPSWLSWSWLPRVKLVGAGMGLAWYVVAMRSLADGSRAPAPALQAVYGVGGIEAVLRMHLWMAIRADGAGSGRKGIFVLLTAAVLGLFVVLHCIGFG